MAKILTVLFLTCLLQITVSVQMKTENKKEDIGVTKRKNIKTSKNEKRQIFDIGNNVGFSPFIETPESLSFYPNEPQLTEAIFPVHHQPIEVEQVPLIWKHEIPKVIHKTITKEVRVPVPYPVPYPVEKHVPYPVKVPVPYPVPKPVPYSVIKKVEIPVEKPIPYIVEKKVPFPVRIEVPIKVPVHVPVPYPVKVEKPIYIEKKISVPHPVYIEKLVHVPHPVVIEKHHPVPVVHKALRLEHGWNHGISDIPIGFAESSSTGISDASLDTSFGNRLPIGIGSTIFLQ